MKCLDAAKCDAEGVPLDQRHPDVAVVEEPRLVLQDVLRQQLSQLQERTEEDIQLDSLVLFYLQRMSNHHFSVAKVATDKNILDLQTRYITKLGWFFWF